MTEHKEIKEHEIEVNSYVLIVDFSFDVIYYIGTPYFSDMSGEPDDVEYDNYSYTILNIFGNGGDEVSREEFENTTPDFDLEIKYQLENYRL